MTRRDRGNYASKHPSNKKPDTIILQEVKNYSSNGTITCADAFSIARKLAVPLIDVGFTIDFLEIRISKCQLGLFGYGSKGRKIKPADTLSGELEGMIRGVLSNNKISCKSAWDISEKSEINLIDITSACEKLKIKISECQLGAF